jgi:predicted DNA-binding mobile mystery protein A
MTKNFKKLMRDQVQQTLNDFSALLRKPVPPTGWIRTIRDALGMSSQVLAKRMGCTRANITALEQREKKQTISLEMLEQVAKSLDCKLVYCLVPLESLDKILEKQARAIAKKRIRIINHSMKLEEQGLNQKQLQRQEEELVQELLRGDSKNLWGNDEV